MVEGDLAFVGVTVLPMAGPGGPVVLENQTVVVAGRQIASINPAGEVEVGDDVEVIEAEGQYLMPGLAEMHGHLPSPRMLPADAKNLLFLYVANGVTTVRGMQGDRSQFTTRDQIARSETIGPRLFLGSTSMHGARVTTPEQAEQLVREYKQAGYDLLKVHEDLTLDVFDAMAATASEVGIPFGGHVPDRVGLLHALEAGQVSIDHLDNYIQALVPEETRPADLPGLLDIGALMEVVGRRPHPRSWSRRPGRRAPGSCRRWCSGRRRSTAIDRRLRCARGARKHATCRQRPSRSGSGPWTSGWRPPTRRRTAE